MYTGYQTDLLRKAECPVIILNPSQMLMQFTQTSARIHTLSFPFLHLLSTQSLASRRHKMIPTPITVFILFLLFESIKNGVTSWFTIAVFRGELPVLSVSHLLSHLLFLFFLPKLLWRRKINRLSTKLSFFFPKYFLNLQVKHFTGMTEIFVTAQCYGLFLSRRIWTKVWSSFV